MKLTENEREFIRGFAASSGLTLNGAREAWAAWSRQLSDSDRERYETKGYDSGVREGAIYVSESVSL